MRRYRRVVNNGLGQATNPQDEIRQGDLGRLLHHHDRASDQGDFITLQSSHFGVSANHVHHSAQWHVGHKAPGERLQGRAFAFD